MLSCRVIQSYLTKLSSVVKKCLLGRNVPVYSDKMASKTKLLSNKVYLQVLGTCSLDTTPSLLLFTDSQRYLFNCGEGTQRLFNEQKIKYNKLNNIFFTRICWERCGGLPGMAMTLRDSKKTTINIYGPENLKDLMNGTRFFIFHEKMKYVCTQYNGIKDTAFTDENLTLTPVVIQAHKKDDPSNDKSHARKDEKLNSEQQHPDKKIKLDPGLLKESIVCYICQLVSVPGKFLLNKAKELGVPKGPLYGKLKNGENVILEDGTEVCPEQVTEPTSPGPVVLFIDCPCVDYIPNIVNNHSLCAFHEGPSNMAPVIIVHMVPMAVYNHPDYVSWSKKFGERTEHLLINSEVCSDHVAFRRQATIQCKLNTLDPSIFPLLYQSPKKDLPQFPIRTMPGAFCLQYHLRPLKQQGYSTSDVPEPLNVQELKNEAITAIKDIKKREDSLGFDKMSPSNDLQTPNLDLKAQAVTQDTEMRLDNKSETKSKISETKHNVSPDNCTDLEQSIKSEDKLSPETLNLSDVSKVLREKYTSSLLNTCNQSNSIADSDSKHDNREKGALDLGSSLTTKSQGSVDDFDFEVVFIGTGASLPSKYRNVSSTLLSISNEHSVLLDCGEGTLGQLYRHYGNKADDVIRRISCVFISHMHADHHLGLLSVLLRQAELAQVSDTAAHTLVIGPLRMRSWLTEYSSLCEHLDFRFMECFPDSCKAPKYLDCLDVKISVVPVDHCAFAYGLVLSHVTGWKVVYSGDTRPCKKLIDAGAGATLLIHEATLEDEMTSEAIEKKHSTTTEAISSGLKMSARFIMLNHFSQRYPKIPVFNEKFTKHTGIAFDHMTIRPRDFDKIPSLLPALKVLFAEEVEELTQNTEIRRNKLNANES
ncbi:zinc phosphodiesterase ELAC protein 2 [Nematostella vectensis]|uniref:zinc phosphodiesterase ELAC protein 2 n=1 Tax=Nematostella vectensis TaxID=45351 RepID=UPI0020776962|nr:zinc phosphodiesterase ELAC protein 2 [Nematostella vectensis]